MENDFKEPKFNTTPFTCPHCQAIAQMNFIIPSETKQKIYLNLQDIKANYLVSSENSRNRVNNIRVYYRYLRKVRKFICNLSKLSKN